MEIADKGAQFSESSIAEVADGPLDALALASRIFAVSHNRWP